MAVTFSSLLATAALFLSLSVLRILFQIFMSDNKFTEYQPFTLCLFTYVHSVHPTCFDITNCTDKTHVKQDTDGPCDT